MDLLDWRFKQLKWNTVARALGRKAWAESTLLNYSKYWGDFKESVRKNKILSESVVINHLAEMFARGLKPTTLKAVASCLNSMMTLIFPEFIKPISQIKRLLKGAARDRPVQRKSTRWDVDKVLRMLRLAPFLEEKSVENILGKAIFLIMLASGARISEVLYLSNKKSVITSNQCAMVLDTMDGFVKKNENGMKRKTLTIIRCLKMRGKNECHPNCPINAIRGWKKWRNKDTRECKWLFSDPGDCKKRLKFGRAALLISRLVKKGDSAAVNPVTHDLRKLAASIAHFDRKRELEEIREFVGWSSVEIIKSRYLQPVRSDERSVVLGRE